MKSNLLFMNYFARNDAMLPPESARLKAETTAYRWQRLTLTSSEVLHPSRNFRFAHRAACESSESQLPHSLFTLLKESGTEFPPVPKEHAPNERNSTASLSDFRKSMSR